MSSARHRYRDPSQHRARPWLVPTELRNVPVNAFRSHLIPVNMDPLLSALQEMRDQPSVSRSRLPQKQAQSQWKKDADGNWYQWDTHIRGFIEAMEKAPTRVRMMRLYQPPWPQQDWETVAQQLQDELWEQIHTSTELPSDRRALDRDIPYAGRLPAAAIESLDQFEMWAAVQHQVQRRDARVRAMAELRAQDAYRRGLTQR